jgi:hypothetical protein
VTVHAHRAYGDLELHLVGLPANDNPLGLDMPTVVAVSPLLRELILAYTRDPDQPLASGPGCSRCFSINSGLLPSNRSTCPHRPCRY